MAFANFGNSICVPNVSQKSRSDPSLCDKACPNYCFRSTSWCSFQLQPRRRWLPMSRISCTQPKEKVAVRVSYTMQTAWSGGCARLTHAGLLVWSMFAGFVAWVLILYHAYLLYVHHACLCSIYAVCNVQGLHHHVSIDMHVAMISQKSKDVVPSMSADQPK